MLLNWWSLSPCRFRFFCFDHGFMWHWKMETNQKNYVIFFFENSDFDEVQRFHASTYCGSCVDLSMSNYEWLDFEWTYSGYCVDLSMNEFERMVSGWGCASTYTGLCVVLPKSYSKWSDSMLTYSGYSVDLSMNEFERMVSIWGCASTYTGLWIDLPRYFSSHESIWSILICVLTYLGIFLLISRPILICVST